MTAPSSLSSSGASRPGNRPLAGAVLALAAAVAALVIRANASNPRAVWYCTVSGAAVGAPQDSTLMDTTTMTPLVVLDRATGQPRARRDSTLPVTAESIATVTISAPCAMLVPSAPDTTALTP